MPEIRNFIGYGNKPPLFKWENNAKLAVQFVLNYEEGAENTVLNGDKQSEIFLSEIIGAEPVIGQRNMNIESIYEYGSRNGFWRIYNEFTKRKLPLTIFGVALALEKNLEVCDAIKHAKFEVASHGYRWIDYQHVDPKIEEEHIIKSNQIIKNIFGYYPSGWYTGRTSPNTRNLVLKNTDVLYDSDAYDDDIPYWVKPDNKKHLIIPYTLDNNDMRFATTQGFNTGDDFYYYLKDSFDTLYTESEKSGSSRMMSIGLHCRIIGRPGRFQSLLKFLNYLDQFNDIWICSRKQIAEFWYDQF
ncbi:allantoinase PuuE [Alphaproteobacteria bacterium]|nr:allantoinase PuuE [Alphaproteobacteria bacterium]